MPKIKCSLRVKVYIVVSATIAALKGASLQLPEHMQKGHVPGAVHLLEDDVLDEDTKCLLPEAELKQGKFTSTSVLGFEEW